MNTIFDRDAVPAVAQLRRYGVALIAIVAVTTIDLLERIFGTTELTPGQWGICLGIAATLVLVEEVIKLVLRHRQDVGPGTAAAVVTPPAYAA